MRGGRRRRRTWVQRLILTMNVVLIGASLAAFALLQYGYDTASDIQRIELGRSLTAVPEEAAVGQRVLNVLLVGSDSSAGLDPDDPVQIGRRGERFGDVIMVAHIDERSSQLALLSFPRDLWLPLAGVNRSDRINRAFEVGGPAMLIDTIEANFDLPIHHYVNVDFAGFQGLVEAVGSVDVYFETPARDWNVNAVPEPRSQTGFLVAEAGCHSLDPPTALAYVRSRYYQTQQPDGSWVTDPTSDFGRISRQQDFLKRLLYRAVDLGARNPFVLADMVDTGLENVAIDESLTPQLLVDLGIAFQNFDPGALQTYSFPVIDSDVNGNQVLEPLTAEAEPLLELMRGAAHDDPSTVGLSIVSATEPDADVEAMVSTLLEGLTSAGFETEIQVGETAVGSLTVRHGPNGRAAAEIVTGTVAGILADDQWETNFATTVSVEEVEHLKGRTVQLAVGSSTVDPNSGVESGALNRPGNSSQGGPGPTKPASPTSRRQVASAVESGGPATTIAPIVDGDGSMVNGSPSSTLTERNRESQESRGQLVDSEEPACRSR